MSQCIWPYLIPLFNIVLHSFSVYHYIEGQLRVFISVFLSYTDVASSSTRSATPDVADGVCDVGSSGPCGGRCDVDAFTYVIINVLPYL